MTSNTSRFTAVSFALLATMPALAQSSSAMLSVSVTVTRGCAVQTVAAGSSAQVKLACASGAPPPLVGGTLAIPTPMPIVTQGAAAPLASTPNAAAATTSQTAATAARPASAATLAAAAAVAAAAAESRLVTPLQTVTLLTPTDAIGGSAVDDRPAARLVTINF
jgi:hypothetical protein